MKKVLLMFLMFFISPVFATGISGTSAPCDNETLSKYNGTANIEINWEPNVIGLSWYDGDTQLSVPTESQSCVYDDVVTVPPQPTKLGYTFNGWKVVPRYDFSTLDASILATTSFYKINNRCYDSSSEVSCNLASTSDLQNDEWKAIYTYGAVYGKAMLSTSTVAPPLENNSGNTCWCKATHYTPNGDTVRYSPTKELPWVSIGIKANYRDCIWGCRPTQSVVFRQSLFGQIQ